MKLVRGGRPLPPQRAVSAVTAREVRRMLEQVVTPEGTARRAAIAGYGVAGKTGTVRKVIESGGYGSRHQSLFVGMVPAERPRLVGLVMIDEPGPEAYYGGLVSAPVFSRVMQDAARLLQISPDGTDAPELAPALPRTVAYPLGADAARPRT